MYGIFRPKAWERDPEGRFRYGSYEHESVNMTVIPRDSVGTEKKCAPRKNTTEYQYLRIKKKMINL